MSVNPFTVLADSLVAFTDEWLRIVESKTWIAGSAAEAECAADALADEWGDYPCRDAWISAHTTANAGLDHLRALALLLPADGVVLALSTTARGALEAFAAAHYLTAPDIVDARERVRRYMNTRLASLHDSQRQFPADSADGEVLAAREHVTGRIRRVTDSARRQGFAVRRTRRGVPYLDHELPSVTRLCEAVVSDTPRLGALYYSQLSAVAHARAHGLSAHTQMVVPAADRATGDGLAAVAISPREAALHLLAAPMAAAGVVQRLFPACGWELTTIGETAQGMLSTWGRIGDVPYPTDAEDSSM